MFVFPVLIILSTILLIAYLVTVGKTRPKNFPPGPPRLPFWGSYWYVLKENYYFLHKGLDVLAKRYKTDILGLHFGPYPAVVVYDYELCKEVLTRDEFNGRLDTVIARARGSGSLLGIFFVDGLYWKEQRRYSLRQLRDFGFGRRFSTSEAFIETEIRGLVEFLTSDPKPCDYDICTKKGVVRSPDIFSGPSLNAILSILCKRRFENFELRKIARVTMEFLRCSDVTGSAVCMTPWLRFIAPTTFGYSSAVNSTKVQLDFLKGVIKDHIETFSDDHHRDFIDVYLSQVYALQNEDVKYSFTEEQLIYTVLDYMFPAGVAIGHTLNYLLGYLLNQPEIQTRIQEEIDNVVGKSRLPTLDDRQHLHYTEATIREILRKEPITPLGLTRRCTEETTLRGYTVPKDCMVIANLWTAHNDPKLWGDPENFRPERWLDDAGKLLKKDVTVPFGAGKRLCAGETFARQMLFLFVGGLMQNFTLKVPAGRKLPDLNEHIWGFIVVRPDIYFEAVPR